MATKPMKTITTLAELIQDDRNANKGTKRGAAIIAESLKRHGAGRSVLIDAKGRLIAGNKTAAAAHAGGIKRVRVIQTTGDEIIAVQRTDLDLKRDPAARALAVADNRASELSLSWDGDVLAAIAKDADLGYLFSDAEIAKLLNASGGEGEGAGAEQTNAELEALRARYDVKAGQLWGAGPHRVLCGNSAAASSAATAIGELNPVVMATDPPYGVNYDPQWRARVDGNKRHGDFIQGDEKADWSCALAHFPGHVAYVWHGAMKAVEVALGLERIGFEIRAQIIWVKNKPPLSRGAYSWQHEPCWYAVRKGNKASWAGGQSQSTVWESMIIGQGGGGRATRPRRTKAGRALHSPDPQPYQKGRCCLRSIPRVGHSAGGGARAGTGMLRHRNRTAVRRTDPRSRIQAGA